MFLRSLSASLLLSLSVTVSSGGGSVEDPSDLSFAFPDKTPRQRARDLGIVIGHLKPGPWNAITDVAGVRVGHSTVVFGSGPLVVGKGPARTGVTAVIPHDGLVWRENVPAATWRLNGAGEMTGGLWVNEKGSLETPILLTNSWSIGAVFDHFLSWGMSVDKDFNFDGCDPVVAETWDGFLNDIRGRHVHQEHVFSALNEARSGPVAEGAVGGGTGMQAFEFKAGIGTSSRVVEDIAGRAFTVGVLVQANFGDRRHLRIDGVPVGEDLTDLMPEAPKPEGSSFLAVLATDAPLGHHELQRLNKRMAMGLARTGSTAGNSSGDLFIAFSTAYRITTEDTLDTRPALKADQMNPLFVAAVEATEEAIVNALCMARTTVGRDGNTVYALPLDRLQEVMRRYGRLAGRPAARQ